MASRIARDYNFLLATYYWNCFESPMIETKTKHERLRNKYNNKLKRNTLLNII